MLLDFKPALEHPELLAKPVLDFIHTFDKDRQITVAEINPDYADGELLSQQYDMPFEMEVNCLVVKGQRGEDVRYAALLVPYGKKAKTNATIKRPLDVAKVSFAPLDEVLSATQMEFGSITPIGLPQDWSILIDAELLQQEQLILGAGLVKAKLCLPADILSKLPNVQIIEELAK